MILFLTILAALLARDFIKLIVTGFRKAVYDISNKTFGRSDKE